ncbi:MAG TPA: tetratricopeptide repeat protein [Actinomycetota bacterium]|nr:tetratricopeptide repeat protein [Actinomycetota bacterium]
MTKGPVAEGLGRVEELSDAGRYEAALEELDRQVAQHPDESAVHTARGWALENLGPDGLAGARDAYARALELDPTALWAKEGLSNVFRRMGDVEAANSLAKAVIEEGTPRAEKEIDLLELIGWCQLRLGLYPEAVATLRRALELDGRWTAVRFDLALALMCEGDRGRAFLEYQRGIHQAVNGGVERLRGVVRMGLDDLEECLAERPALAGTREAIAARDLLRSTLRVASKTA